jgi:hypothetical protein
MPVVEVTRFSLLGEKYDVPTKKIAGQLSSLPSRVENFNKQWCSQV